MTGLLVLPLEPNETYTRECFRIGVNQNLFSTLFSPDHLWVHGDSAVGKTHAMHVLVTELDSAILVTDDEYELTGLEAFFTVVLDGVDQWIGNEEKERQIFGLYERLVRAKHRLVITSGSEMERLEFVLPDLRSRFSMFTSYHMLPLPPSEQLAFLQDLVKKKGATLSTEVGRYLLRHVTRSQIGLVQAVSRLNEESIFRNRTISIPLVKEVFSL
ncbi:MAG: DnaA/Hda family protein [Gammaproteobacteria bacterium]|nr:DnaA/Hda family protein [Gammaproteobacteria bacterium]